MVGRRRKAIILTLVAVAVVAGSSALALRDNERAKSASSGNEAARHWFQTVSDAFGPLSKAAPSHVQTAYEWAEGRVPDSTFGANAATAVEAFRQSSERLRMLKPFGPVPLALRWFRSTAALYEVSGEVYVEAVRIPPDQLRRQLDLLARRVRLIADEVYDLGSEALRPYGADPTIVSDDDLTVEVPVWSQTPFAPGEPLTAAGDQTLPDPSASVCSRLAELIRSEGNLSAEASALASPESQPRWQTIARRLSDEGGGLCPADQP